MYGDTWVKGCLVPVQPHTIIQQQMITTEPPKQTPVIGLSTKGSRDNDNDADGGDGDGGG